MPEGRDEGVDYSPKNEALYFPNNGRQQNFNFDYQKAVAYAKKYNKDDTTKHFNADCTSFVSFCWRDAGIPEDYGDDGWYCTSPGLEDYKHSSYAWRCVPGFCTYMSQHGYIDVVNKENLFWKYACLGDVIQLGGAHGDNWHHSLLIVDIIGPEIRVTGHTDTNTDLVADGIYSLAEHSQQKQRLLHIKGDFRF